MPKFKVGLARTCSVTVEAVSREDAMKFAEFFIVEQDGATLRDQDEFGFTIEEIEMVCNDSFECEEIEKVS